MESIAKTPDGVAAQARTTLLRSPRTRLRDIEANPDTVASIIAARLRRGTPDLSTIITNMAKAVKVDPNAPLTSEQKDRAIKIVDAYAKRTGQT